MVKIERFRLFLLFSIFFGLFLMINPAAAGSNLSSSYSNLFLLVTILSVIVGVGVIAVWILFIVRYRETNTEQERNAISHETARKLEMTWTSLAVLIVILLMIFSYPVLLKVDHDATNLKPDADVEVVAHQFQFLFTVLDGSNQTAVANPTLHAGMIYQFNVTSIDVIHSLFVPGLRFKMDAIPGSYNFITIKILDTGSYPVWCNEYCGAGHSFMRQSIEVVP